MVVNSLIEIDVQGKHWIPGRGVTFVADMRENEFNLIDLKVGDTVVIQQEVWVVRHLECARGMGDRVAPVIGIVVRKELN